MEVIAPGALWVYNDALRDEHYAIIVEGHSWRRL